MKNYTLFDEWFHEQSIDPQTIQGHGRFVVPRSTGEKNKGRKHRIRGNRYSGFNRKLRTNKDDYISYVKETLGTLLKRETPSFFYIQCAYHTEKNASMAISKTRLGLVKCFGCGITISFERLGRETSYKPLIDRKKLFFFDHCSGDEMKDDDLPF